MFIVGDRLVRSELCTPSVGGGMTSCCIVDGTIDMIDCFLLDDDVVNGMIEYDHSCFFVDGVIASMWMRDLFLLLPLIDWIDLFGRFFLRRMLVLAAASCCCCLL